MHREEVKNRKMIMSAVSDRANCFSSTVEHGFQKDKLSEEQATKATLSHISKGNAHVFIPAQNCHMNRHSETVKHSKFLLPTQHCLCRDPAVHARGCRLVWSRLGDLGSLSAETCACTGKTPVQIRAAPPYFGYETVTLDS
jgi:hypothetical protein